MFTIEREQFKVDPEWKPLHQHILKHHKVADHTAKILWENRHTENFCEEAVHFMYIRSPKGNMLYFHYEVSSWYHTDGAQVKVDRIVIYDDYKEYNSARLKGIHGTKDSDGVNLN